MIEHGSWKGEAAFIIGGGPSLNSVSLDPLHERRVIGVNNAYRLGNWIDICWFGDTRWWKWHHRELQLDHKDLPLASCNEDEPLRRIKRIKFYKRGHTAGIDVREEFISWNHSSGGSAINLAYHMGCREIVLLGFDMKLYGEKKNWHDDHKDQNVKVEDSSFKEHYQNVFNWMINYFKVIKAHADKLDVKIINCSPGSKMKCFPIMELEAYLERE